MGTLGLNKDKRYKQGYYYPKNKEKYVGKVPYAIYRSGLELNYFRILDSNPNVIKWGSEEIVIPYFWGENENRQKWHKYYIDLFAIFKFGDKIKKWFIELKPHKHTQEPSYSKRKKESTYLYECQMYSQNMAKWKYAKEFAEKNDFEFHILTEKDLDNKKK